MTAPALTMKRLVSLLLAALFLAVAMVSLSASPAARADGDTSGISGAPSDGSSTDDRSRFSYQVSPGQQISDNYLVQNTGTVPQTMKVFATDAYNTDDGSFGLLDTDSAPKDAGSWVTFEGGATQLAIPLDPGQSKIVPFTMVVPADASPGDHAAGIVISVLSTDGQVLVDRRVATRLYARIAGDLQASLTVSSISASYGAELNPFTGTTTVTYTVRNNGNVALGANTVVGVNTYFGLAAGSLQHSDLAEMLPGSTRTVSVQVAGVGQLGYLNPYVSLSPTVDADALDPGALAVVDRDTVIVAVPWWLVALVVLALAVFLFLRWRRARDEKNAKAWLEYTEAEARRKAGQKADEPVAAG